MRPVLLFLPFLMLVPSCGNLQNLAQKARTKRQQKAMEQLTETSSEEATARLGAKAVGEIAYVDEAEQFVLIRTLTGINLPTDASLETRREGKRTGLLRGTAERNKVFTTADLLEGTPRSGDGVFPSTAKPKPKQVARPGSKPSPAAPGNPAASLPTFAPANPNALPEEVVPNAAPLDFDPTNLPSLPDPVRTPEDLKK
jgi:hypothetical protein